MTKGEMDFKPIRLKAIVQIESDYFILGPNPTSAEVPRSERAANKLKVAKLLPADGSPQLFQDLDIWTFSISLNTTKILEAETVKPSFGAAFAQNAKGIVSSTPLHSIDRGANRMKCAMVLMLLIVSSVTALSQAKPPLLEKDLNGIPGKEGIMLIVEYKPGQTGTVHRHNASVFVYVLQGSVVMQVKGKPEETLHVGDTFFESPDDIHVVGKNASSTEPAKFLVFMVKDKGAPISVPVK